MIPVFNEGTQRYHDPDSGRMVKTPSASESTAVGSNLGASSIVAALRSEFKGLNAHLAYRFDSVIQAMRGTDAERRDELISGENTDVPPGANETTENTGKGFMETLRGLNPFKDGIGTKLKIALLAGALFALAKLGPSLVDPLAGFLKWVKEDMGADITALKDKTIEWWDETWPKVQGWFDYMKDTMFPAIQKLYDDTKVWWAEQWPKVITFFDWAKGIFTSIGDYIDSFDTDGVEGLNSEERKALFTDMKNKIIGAVGGYVAAVVGGMMLFHFGPALIKTIGMGLASTKIANAIKGTAAANTAAAASTGTIGATLAKHGAKLGIAGIVAAGIVGVYTASRNAFTNAAIDEEGNIDKTSFAGFFLAGGDGEGGWKNAITNGLNKAAIGGAAGVGIAAMAGKFALAGAAGGPMGMLAGGLLGLAIGGVIGASTGAIGADKMTQVIQSVQSTLGKAVDDVARFFGGVVAGIESFVKGNGYTAGRNAYMVQTADSAVDRASEIELLENDVAIEQQLFDQATGKGKQAALKQLNLAKTALRNAKNKDNNLKQLESEVKQRNLESSINEANRLPGLYSTLASADPNKPRGKNGTNLYDRTLANIQKIEGAIPGYMLSDIKMQQASGTGAFTPKTALVPAKPTSFESTPLLLPSLISKDENNYINSSFSMDLSPNDTYSSVRVLGLDGAF